MQLDPEVLILEPRRGWVPFDFGELWRYRELLGFLAWRDVKVRYKQTALGALWAVVQPLLTMLVFAIFFGRLAKMPSDGVPYPLFALTGLVPWTLFAQAMPRAAESLVGSANLLTKIYFPRLIVPAAAVVAATADFFCSFAVLIAFLAWYGIVPSAKALLLIPLTAIALATAAGVGFFMGALNVRFRDVRHTLPFLVQFWMFATPVAYPTSLVPKPWRELYAMNPMVCVVEGYRWVLVGSPPLGAGMLGISSVVAVCALIAGAAYFRQVERNFADVI